MNPAGRDAILEYNIANGLVKSAQPTTAAPLSPVLVIDACPDDAPTIVAISAMTPEQRAAFDPLTVDGLPVTRGGLVWSDESQKCIWNADAVTIEYKGKSQ